MHSPARTELLSVKRVLETSTKSLNALVSVVDDDLSRRKCITDLERTKNAISSIEKLIQNL